MILIRKSADRGYADYGWLKTYHSFSFDTYYDAQFMGFGSLRVINHDFIAGGGGFPLHGHRNMEIVTYVIKGALAHKDSLGNTAIIRPGEAQRMSAGRGIRHSEFNNSAEEPVELLQIWIEPSIQEIEPSYEQQSFLNQQKINSLILIAGPTGSGSCVTIHQNAKIHALHGDSSFSYNRNVGMNEKIWIQMIEGDLEVNSNRISAGDAAGIQGGSEISIQGKKDFHCLLFELRA